MERIVMPRVHNLMSITDLQCVLTVVILQRSLLGINA